MHAAIPQGSECECGQRGREREREERMNSLPRVGSVLVAWRDTMELGPSLPGPHSSYHVSYGSVVKNAAHSFSQGKEIRSNSFG